MGRFGGGHGESARVVASTLARGRVSLSRKKKEEKQQSLFSQMALGGGCRPFSVVEFYGAAGSGKTQLALQVCECDQSALLSFSFVANKRAVTCLSYFPHT